MAFAAYWAKKTTKEIYEKCKNFLEPISFVSIERFLESDIEARYAKRHSLFHSLKLDLVEGLDMALLHDFIQYSLMNTINQNN